MIISGCRSDSASNFGKKEFLNVSYDPTRELYAAYNEKFNEHWRKELGNGEVTLTQSHCGSGKQARAVIEGLEADVVTLALAYDVIEIKNAVLIQGGWQTPRRTLRRLFVIENVRKKRRDTRSTFDAGHYTDICEFVFVHTAGGVYNSTIKARQLKRIGGVVGA